MNIVWNEIDRVFVAEFSADFAGDLEAVKNAGFKPLGVPPPWLWHAPSPGVRALNRLRQNRPASGLTISTDALAIYTPLAQIEAKNEEVRAALSAAKKIAKKEQKKREENLPQASLPDGRWWTVGPEDLPPSTYQSQTKVLIEFPGEKILCEGCGDRLYFYDYPDLCLWCSKNKVLDSPFFL